MEPFTHFYNYLRNPSIQLLILIVVAIIAGEVISYMLNKYLEKYTASEKSTNLQLFVKHISPLMYLFVPLLMLNIVLPMFGYESGNGEYELLDSFMRALLVISIAGLFIEATNFAEGYLNRRFDIEAANNLTARKVRTQVKFLKRITITLIIILAVSLILMSFESARRIGAGLLTSAGIITGIITFAAQNSISNIWSGLLVAFTQPIRIDDVLIVEGENCRVEEITLSYVILRTWDRRRLILPTSYFTKTPFQNWTYSTTDVIGVVYIYVDYSLPVDALRAELKQLLENHPLWDKKTSAVQVTEADNKTMQIRILASAKTAAIAFDLRCDLREKLIAFIRDRYPQCLPKGRVEECQVEAWDQKNMSMSEPGLAK